jgi:hypothetical protein
MKKGLIAVLIAANLLMLVLGILTIPPNLRSAATGKKPPVIKTEQTTPVTPSPKGETPPATTESGSIPAPKETGVNLSTEERPDLGDFLWYTEDVLYNGVPSDANIIDNIGPLTGSWKALIIYDPNNEHNSSAMEFLNIALAGTAESLSLTLDDFLGKRGRELRRNGYGGLRIQRQVGERRPVGVRRGNNTPDAVL